MKALTKLAVVCLLAAAMAVQAVPVVQADNLRTAHPDRATLSNAGEHPPARNASRAELAEAYGKIPLSFEANQGQFSPQVKFISRGKGYNLFLTPAEAVLVLKRDAAGGKTTGDDRAVVRMRLDGGNPAPSVTGTDELSGKSNYFVGRDPRKWRTDVANYARVNYREVYTDIDLVYYGNHSQLEYDFVVRAGGDPNAITMRFEGADGLKIDEAGDLILTTGAGEIRQRKPSLYQEANGVRQTVAGSYALRGDGGVGFAVGEYDRSRELVIDPVLSYSTYLGGFGNEQGNAIAVDSEGRAYVTGRTDSFDFPTQNPRQSFGGVADVFVSVLNPAGNALVYSTFLGGGSIDQGSEIAVDAAGRAYVTGSTSSLDFPATAGAFQPYLGGNNDAFLARLSASGNALEFSTYLGGSGPDASNGVALGGDGVYLTGFTFSTNFPTRLPLQTVNRGGGDAFVAKLNLSGGALVYSTYLGGSGRDDGNSIAVDSAGSAYLAGNTTSSMNFPTANAVRPTYGGGTNDGFVTKLNQAGGSLVFSTYLGGFSTDVANAVALDNDGSAYVTGVTSSSNFPTANPLQGFRGLDDAFVTKFSPSGGAFVYSTYLGGKDGDSGEGIAVTPNGMAYVTGRTNSLNFPAVSPVQANNRGLGDAFVASLNTAGSALLYSTYLGGSSTDSANDIAVDATRGDVYVTGVTASFDFPTQAPFQPSRRGNNDAFVAKIGEAPLSLSLTPASQSIQVGQDAVLTVALSAAQGSGSVVALNSSNAGTASVQPSATIPAGQTSAPFNARGNSPGTVTLTATFGALVATATVTVTHVPTPTPTPTPAIWLDPASQTVQVNDVGMLTVSISAPQGSDSLVALSSSNAGISSVQPSVTIPAGQPTASFPVSGVSPGAATITATFGNSVANALVNVETASAAPDISLSPASQTIQAGQGGALTVTLSPAQSSDTVISLASSSSGVASVPSSVTIPAGQPSASFAASGNAAGQATINATLPASLGGGTASATVNVNGAPQQPPTISLSPLSQTIQLGGTGAMLTVTISAAQDGDTPVSFTSTNPAAATVPGVVVLPRGATSVSVPVTANAAGTAGFIARLPAALGGSGAKAIVTVAQ